MEHGKRTRPGAALIGLALCLGLLTGCGASPQMDIADEHPQTQTSANADSGTSQETPPEEMPPTQISGGDTEDSGTSISALPDDFPMELTFSSGAGGWRTLLTLQPDGSFTGQYTDWDSGGDPSQYPKGIYYICTFSGIFKDLRQLDDTTYSMTLDTLTAQETEGKEWTEDGTQYIGAAPYGLEGGSEFFFYAPEAVTDVMTPQTLQVEWPQWNLPETVPEGQLGCWMLLNRDMDQAFFSYD